MRLRINAGLRILMAIIAAMALLPAPAIAAQVYDFCSSTNVNSAVWKSQGYIPVTVANPWDKEIGDVDLATTQTEDGDTVLNLLTRPPERTRETPRAIEGTYSNIAIPAGGPLLKFQARIGFRTGAANSDGAIFSVWVKGAGDSEFYQLSLAEAEYDNVMNLLAADVTAFKGQTVSVKLRVECGPDQYFDYAAWEAAEIVEYGTTDYDFVASASGAAWKNEKSPNGTTLTFGAGLTSAGAAQYYTGSAEDGFSYTNALYSHPNYDATVYAIQGKFSRTIATGAAAARFIARIGYKQNSGSSDSLTFQLLADENQDGTIDKALGVQDVSDDGRLDFFSVDVSQYINDPTDFYLRVIPKGGSSDANDKGLWTEAKIVRYDPETLYDFIAEADQATWETQNGVNTLTFPTNPPSSTGAVNVNGNLLVGGSNPQHLLTVANTNATPYYIVGYYDNVVLPSNMKKVSFSATVGFEDAAASTASGDFIVYVARRGKVDEIRTETQAKSDGLAAISANLSGYLGQNVSILLSFVPSGTPSTSYYAAWVAPKITAVLPVQIFADETGAIVNDSNDDLAALDLAVALAKTAAPAEVHFQTGVYNLSASLDLDGVYNLNLRGSASGTTELLMADATESVIEINRSRNISTRNLTLDYSSLNYTQGVISNVNTGAKTFTLTIDSGHRELNDSLFIPNNNECWGTFHVNDPTNFPGYPQKDNTSDLLQLTGWTGGSGVYNCTASSDMTNITNGMKAQYSRATLWTLKAPGAGASTACVAKDLGWGTEAIWIDVEEGHISWDYVTVYHSPLLTFLAEGIEKLFVRNCTVKIRPGTNRIKGSQGDGVHAVGCRRGPDVLDSTFQSMSDDGVNLGSLGYRIMQIDGPGNTRMRVDRNWGFPLTEGDSMQTFRPSSGTLGNVVTVTDIINPNVAVTFGANTYYCMDITVDPAPQISGGIQVGENADRFFNQDWGSHDYLVDNCAFRDLRGRGLLLQTSNGVATHNTVERVCMEGVWAGGDPYWNEGLLVNNMLVEGNTFTRCGFTRGLALADFWYADTRGRAASIIRVAGVLADGNNSPATSMLNSNVTIKDNVITEWPRHAMFLCNTANVAITGNTLYNSNVGYKAQSGKAGSIFVQNIDKDNLYSPSYSITNNTVTDTRSYKNGKIFHWNTDSAGDISTSGNSYNYTGSELTSTSAY